jgi:hypothetical protein
LRLSITPIETDALAARALAERATAAGEVRRRAFALRDGPRAAALGDEAALARASLRRLAQRQKHGFQVNPKLEARLRVLDACLAEVARVHESSCSLETALLVALWSRAEADDALAPSLQAIERDWSAARRLLFRVSFEQPDAIGFALYSEHADWLRELLFAYAALIQDRCGEITAITAVKRAADPKAPLEVEPVKHVQRFLDQPPEHLYGAVIHARGDLVAPLFQMEAGLHVWKPARGQGQERVALVEVAGRDYRPPKDLGRSGAIASRDLPRRRAFSSERREVVDARLEPSKREWQPCAPRSDIRQLAAQALEQAITRDA